LIAVGATSATTTVAAANPAGSKAAQSVAVRTRRREPGWEAMSIMAASRSHAMRPERSVNPAKDSSGNHNAVTSHHMMIARLDKCIKII
jgi:hypothetical protein